MSQSEFNAKCQIKRLTTAAAGLATEEALFWDIRAWNKKKGGATHLRASGSIGLLNRSVKNWQSQIDMTHLLGGSILEEMVNRKIEEEVQKLHTFG